jgi:hypothetical protein
MRHLKRLLALLALIGLAACGGGGGSAGTPGVGGGSSGVADVVIVLSSDTIANTGAATVTATVTAVDGNRRGVSGATVSVAVDNNAVVSQSSTTTDAAGAVTATIGIGADRTNRNINVTASVGGITRSTVLRVVTDPNSGTPLANDLSLTLSAPSVTNGGGSTITATATAVDSNRNVVAGIPVSFSVDNGATATVSGAVTNASGVVTAVVGIGSDRSNRRITVTATSGTLVRTAFFDVTGAKLTSSASPLVVAGSANVIEYTLVDFNAVAMANQTISVSGNGLPTVSGQTDLNGKFRYNYNAPASPITLNIVATGAGDQNTRTVSVTSAGSGIPAASEFPQSASVTPTPTVVAVNTVGSTTNQVELRALFVGVNNKPIKNVRARFDLAGNASNTDGVISMVGSYAYSDDNGIARATFTPGQLASPTNGVTVRVCYDIFDFASPSPTSCDGAANTATATLTVASEALAVSIRTNNQIKEGRNGLTYIKEYVVMVVDSAGQAKRDVQITPSVDLDGYYKGHYTWNGTVWQQVMTLASTEKYIWTGSAWDLNPDPANIICPNEDVNRNGVREAGTFGGSAPALSARQEDMNWNGELDPRKSDVAITMVDSAKTDANGLAIVQIEYGKNLGSWLKYTITVTASGVSGTEARARYVGILPVLASELTVETVAPSFVLSPYGNASVCTNPN